MSGIVLRILIGGAAGLGAWALMEPTAPQAYGDASWGAFELRLILLIGAFIGGALGWLEGWRRGAARKMIQGFVAGILFGAIGAAIGMAAGSVISNLLLPGALDSQEIARQIPARVLVITPLGFFIGLAVGASTFNPRRAGLTSLGGILAGVVAGLCFDPVSLALAPILMAARSTQAGEVAEIGMVGRGLLAGLLGVGIGLFIGFLEQVLKTAWVRQELGRKEGREWIVDAPVTVIGRSEAAQVPLFGDPSVAPNHASIVRQGEAYWLFDAGTPSGTLLNGQRVGQAPLQSGDRITLGAENLIFLLRAGSAPARAAEALRGTATTPSPVPAPVATAVPVPSVAPPSRAELFALSGPLGGQRYPVGVAIEVGREATGIKLGYDSMASRRHARIETHPDGVLVTDLGSTNGTFINGTRIPATAIAKTGDVLKIGSTEFRVERS